VPDNRPIHIIAEDIAKNAEEADRLAAEVAVVSDRLLNDGFGMFFHPIRHWRLLKEQGRLYELYFENHDKYLLLKAELHKEFYSA